MLVIRLIYFALVFLCIAISLYLTSTFLNLTIGFTAVIGLLLLGADVLIQRNRERGTSLLGAFAIFLFVAFFSSVSNFNYLYTNFMTKDVLTATLREQYAVFRNNLTETESVLRSTETYRRELDRRAQLETQLQQLRPQINDRSRPGCGERCEEILATIDAILGTPVTDIARPGPGASIEERNAFIENYSALVLTTRDTSPVVTSFRDVNAVIAKINEELRYYDTAQTAIDAGVDLQVLSNLSEAGQEIERLANAVLPPDAAVEHAPIDPTLGRLGEIVYSLRNGFAEMPNPGATYLALILSVLIDFVPVAFALVAFRPEEKTIPEMSGTENADIFNF